MNVFVIFLHIFCVDNCELGSKKKYPSNFNESLRQQDI